MNSQVSRNKILELTGEGTFVYSGTMTISLINVLHLVLSAAPFMPSESCDAIDNLCLALSSSSTFFSSFSKSTLVTLCAPSPTFFAPSFNEIIVNRNSEEWRISSLKQG